MCLGEVQLSPFWGSQWRPQTQKKVCYSQKTTQCSLPSTKNKALPPSIHPVRRSPSLLFPNDTTTSSVLPLTHVLQPQCPPLDVPLIERPQPMTSDGISSLHFHFHPFFSQALALDELQGTVRLVLRATRSPPLRRPIL